MLQPFFFKDEYFLQSDMSTAIME